MAKFFINRPIVAMVISIIMVIAGAVTILALPTALFPEIAPPEIKIEAVYTGADGRVGAARPVLAGEMRALDVDPDDRCRGPGIGLARRRDRRPGARACGGLDGP